MSILPGAVVGLLTFPGVIVHEWAHKIAAEARGLDVQEVCYFQLGSPPGYVTHEPARNYTDAFAVTLAPFFVNTAVAILIYSLIPFEGPAAVPFSILATMVAMHAIPSPEDGENLWNQAKKSRLSLMVLTIPIVGILYVLSLLKIVWIDLIYAVAVIVFAGVLNYHLHQLL